MSDKLCPVCGSPMQLTVFAADDRAPISVWDCTACFGSSDGPNLDRFWALDADARALRRKQYVEQWKADADAGYIQACRQLGLDGFDGERPRES